MQDQITAQAIQAAHLAAIATAGPLSQVPADIAVTPGAIGRPAGPGLTARALSAGGRAARRAGRYVAALWRALPGPWPVKALLVAVAVAEPGPFGEMALAAYASAVAAHRARKTRR